MENIQTSMTCAFVLPLCSHTKKTLPWTVSLYNWICMGKRLFTRSIASVGQDPRMPFISGHLSG